MPIKSESQSFKSRNVSATLSSGVTLAVTDDMPAIKEETESCEEDCVTEETVVVVLLESAVDSFEESEVDEERVE